jgi:hypothetical protein
MVHTLEFLPSLTFSIMMKKTLLVSAIIAGLSLTTAFAADTTSWDPTLHQATSCAEVESVVTSYMKNNWSAGIYSPMVR